jgi:hypothetical protein
MLKRIIVCITSLKINLPLLQFCCNPGLCGWLATRQLHGLEWSQIFNKNTTQKFLFFEIGNIIFSIFNFRSQLIITSILASVQFMGTVIWIMVAFPDAERVYPNRHEVGKIVYEIKIKTRGYVWQHWNMKR